MSKKAQRKIGFEKFSDGVCYVFSPQEELPKLKLNFSYYKVGMQRFFTALSSGIKVSECIKVPQQRYTIDASDTVRILDRNFVITQIQHDESTTPSTSILTLSMV